jgi:prophage antirepressor-like protein
MESLNYEIMEANIQIFNSEQFGEVRAVEISGKIYFVGIDITRALGYKNVNDAVTRHCKRCVKHAVLDGQGVMHMTNVIPEGDIYRLAAKSELPAAEAFESWIFDEVLPAIRKTGGYMAVRSDESDADVMARALMIAQRTIEDRNRRIQALQGTNKLLSGKVHELEPRAAYTDTVLMATGTYTMTQVAKELGKSAIALERWLREHGIMFRQSGQYFLYARYQDCGYTKTRTHHFIRSDGTVGASVSTVWTEAGRRFVHGLLGKQGKTEKKGGAV